MIHKIILSIGSLLLAFCAFAQEQTTFFPYPTPPDDKQVLTERCNYLVDHFWERCNIKQSFSSLDRMEGAFVDWLSFMPYATSDTIFMSIDRFLNDVAKSGSDNLVEVAKMAEKWIYPDTAEYHSEQLYEPFVKFFAESKKMAKSQRAHYEKQYKVLASSGFGKKVPNFEFTTADGNKENFDQQIASRIVLMFVQPDCFDCTLTKARLSADYNLNQLINQNLVKVICLYPGKPTEAWKAEAASYPDNWIVGASEEANEYFNIGEMPDIYYLDARHKVLGKKVFPDNLLVALRQINAQLNSETQSIPTE